MHRITLPAFALFGLTFVAAALGADQHHARHRPACRDCGACEVCCPTVEKTTEEVTEWKVECEKKCIPSFRFPWEPGGSKLTLFSWWPHDRNAPRCHCAESAEYKTTRSACKHCAACAPIPCGAVRAVNVLREESREVARCECKWEIRPLPPCCEACHGLPPTAPPASLPEEAPTDMLPLPPE